MKPKIQSFRQLFRRAGYITPVTVLSVLLSAFLQAQSNLPSGGEQMQSGDTIQLYITPNDGFFRSEDPLIITLAFDIRGFQRTKETPEDFQATMTVRRSETDSVTQEITLKARGESRRRVCDFPPIMLNLKGMDGDVPGLEDAGKMKLVTFCKPSAIYENYVLKEYLVYKLYNLLSPYSFRARLVRVNYVDINRPDKPYTAFGFILEDVDEVAERNNSLEIENPSLTAGDMLPGDMLRMSLFQYMIGNTDWAVPSQHNIKFLKSLELFTDKAIPVPYDFDFSGFVFTNYAAPAEELSIKTVRERLFYGACPEEEDLNAAIDEFMVLQDDFIETIASFPYLPANIQKQVLSYLDSFYTLCERRNALINNIMRECRHYD